MFYQTDIQTSHEIVHDLLPVLQKHEIEPKNSTWEIKGLLIEFENQDDLALFTLVWNNK